MLTEFFYTYPLFKPVFFNCICW